MNNYRKVVGMAMYKEKHGNDVKLDKAVRYGREKPAHGWRNKLQKQWSQAFGSNPSLVLEKADDLSGEKKK